MTGMARASNDGHPTSAEDARKAIAGRLLGAIAELCNALPEAEAAALRHLVESTDPAQRMKPLAYSRYFRLLRAVMEGEGDAVEAARALLALDTLDAGPLEVRALNAASFDTSGATILREDFASESLAAWQIEDVPDADSAAWLSEQQAALDLIAAHAPRAWADVSATASEIVVVAGGVRNGTTFDGCSSVERWGSILVNARQEKSLLERAETLVHESAHSLLFALSPDQPLLTNGMGELHRSPLRIDPRPLDGIFHAVFVLDRMASFLDEVRHSSAASPAMRAEADDLLVRRRRDFDDGLAVLTAHAKPTEAGARILDVLCRHQAARTGAAFG